MLNTISLPNVLAALDQELERLGDYNAYLINENKKLTEENNHLHKLLSKALDAESTEAKNGEV